MHEIPKLNTDSVPTSEPNNQLGKRRGRKPNPESPISKIYFGDKEEEAIRIYLSGTLSKKLKNDLFQAQIEPKLKDLVKGVMRMPKFQKLIGINIEQLEEDAYYHLIFQLEKFNPERISAKTGQKVKAYSYFGTIVKNYILGAKIQSDTKIAEHGGDLDVDEMSETLSLPDDSKNAEHFYTFKEEIIIKLDKALTNKRLNKNDLVVGSTLKYMLTNWDKLEFHTKNEFVRLLGYYTQLNPAIVARSLKKFKSFIVEVLKT